MKDKLSEFIAGIVSIFFIAVPIALIIQGIWFVAHLRVQLSENVVSGIVYNASFDKWPNNKTCFSVRAAAEMAVTEDTSPRYCLPAGSQYTDIVRKAAEDKNVKVVVKAKKSSPHLVKGCLDPDDNIEVTIKEPENE